MRASCDYAFGDVFFTKPNGQEVELFGEIEIVGDYEPDSWDEPGWCEYEPRRARFPVGWRIVDDHDGGAREGTLWIDAASPEWEAIRASYGERMADDIASNVNEARHERRYGRVA